MKPLCDEAGILRYVDLFAGFDFANTRVICGEGAKSWLYSTVKPLVAVKFAFAPLLGLI